MKKTAFFALLFLVVPILIPHEASAVRARRIWGYDQTPPRLQLRAPEFSYTGEFRVRVRAEDRAGVARVSIAVNGEIVAARIQEPYAFFLSVESLPVKVCAVAEDIFGNSARDCAVVDLPAPCFGDVACEADEFCNRGESNCEGEGVCEPLFVGEN